MSHILHPHRGQAAGGQAEGAGGAADVRGGGGLYLGDGAPAIVNNPLLLLRSNCRTVDFDLDGLDEVTAITGVAAGHRHIRVVRHVGVRSPSALALLSSQVSTDTNRAERRTRSHHRNLLIY